MFETTQLPGPIGVGFLGRHFFFSLAGPLSSNPRCLCVHHGERIGFPTPSLQTCVLRTDQDLNPASERPQENYAEAIPLLERALAIRTSKLGENHPDTVSTRNILDAVRNKVRA